MELKNYFAQDAQGNTYPNPTCHLYAAGTTELVSGLVDGSNNPLPNPFNGAENGLIQFAAPNGLYDLKVTAGGLSYTLRVQCNDQTETVPNTTNLLTKCLFGRLLPSALSQDYTCQNIMELEGEFMSFRIGVPNIHTAAVPGVRVCVGVVAAATAPAWMIENEPSTPGWMDVTFNGANSVTLPPRLGEERWSLTWSDLIELPSIPRTDSGKRPLVIIRMEIPNGGTISIPANGLAGWRYDGSVRYFKSAKQDGVLGVTNKGSYNQTVNTEQGVMVPLVQYHSVKAGKQFLISGDSTVEGVGSMPSCFGAAQRVAYRHSTPDYPIEYFNAAIHANPPSVYHRRIGDVINDVCPTNVIYSPYSGNDVAKTGMSDDAQRRLKTFTGEVLRFVRQSDCRPEVTLLEGLPTLPSYKDTGAKDAIRVQLNSWVGTLTGVRAAVGYAAAVSGTMDADGQIPLNQDDTGDGVHPNNAGYDKLADNLDHFIYLPLGTP